MTGATLRNPSGTMVNPDGSTAYVADPSTNGDPKILAVVVATGSICTVTSVAA